MDEQRYKIFKTRNAQMPGNSTSSHIKHKSTWTVSQNVYNFETNDQNEKKNKKRKNSPAKPKKKKRATLMQQEATDDIETESETFIQQEVAEDIKTGPEVQKLFEGQIACKCKRGCAVQVDILRQKEYFDYYYSLESLKKRTDFLRAHVSRVKKEKENLNPIMPKKAKKYQYICSLSNEMDEFCRVCLPFFLKLLRLKRKTIYKAISSAETNPLGIDYRGKFPKRMIRNCDLKIVEEFIEQFQTYESQYHSYKISKKFLHPSLNMTGLFSQYKDLCAFRKQKPISKSAFVQNFKVGYHNLAFLKERKLKNCRACDKFERKLKSKLKVGSRSEFRNKKLAHLNLVRKVNKEFAEDIENGEQYESSTEILTFEIFDPFELPSISENTTVLKKQQFWQHTMLIYDELNKRCYVYTWPESIAAKGTAEITSCVRKHIQEYAKESTEKILLYSDPRFGQNRNFKMCLMLKHLLDSWQHEKLNSIEQRFFVPGHAENDCNVSFRLIKRQKDKTENIFISDDCVKIISESKKKSPRFIIKEMQSSDFLSLDPLVDMFGGKENLNEIKKINLSKQQKIIYDRGDPLTMKFIEYNSGSPKSATFQLFGTNVSKFSDIHLPVLFPDGREISKKKFDDLQELSQFIPIEHHTFFKNLKFNPENNSEPDFAFSLRESSDEENENNNN